MRALVGFIALLSLAAAAQSAETPPRSLKPVVVWTGIDGKQTKESFARCGRQNEWEAAWHKNCGRDEAADWLTCPKVDFDSYMVVAIFHGTSHQNHGINILAVTDEPDVVRVRYQPSWYQVGVFGGDDRGDRKRFDTQSYAFAVLPKSRKTVVLEEDVRELIGGPPVWKERARLAVETK